MKKRKARKIRVDYGNIGRITAFAWTNVILICGYGLAAEPGDLSEVTELQEYVVKGIEVEKAISPLSRPIESVYGSEQGLLEIPRAVSVITSALRDELNIDTLEEIIPFTPSASAPNSYGNATTPTIRGDVAENYVNGQRRSGNLFGVDPGFNGVEAVEIVRGPGTAVFGPGFASGGYVNYVTKQPRFDRRRTVVDVRLGSWSAGGGSYLDAMVRVDHNVPLMADRLALRVSWEGQGNETLYSANGGRDDHQDLFVAVHWRPSKFFSLEFNGQYAWQAAPQLLGVNRPHDGLIRDGRYLTGMALDFSNVSPDGFSLRTTVTGTTEIDADRTLLSAGDFSNANVVYGQLIARWRFDSGATVTNRTFLEHIKRRRHHEFSYTEYVSQATFENRTELAWHPKWLGRSNSVLSGFTVRYENREAYMNYFNYYPYGYDVTAGRSFRAEDVYGLFGQPGPGDRLFFGAEEGIPETTHSKLWTPAVFWQHEIELDPRLALIYGIRGNHYAAEVDDPLPPAGAGSRWRDEGEFSSGDFNVSLRYQPHDRLTVYGTYNLTHAVDGSTGGGAIMLSGGKLDAEDFRVESELWEGGIRLSANDNRAYGAVTAFRQDRFRSELGGGRSGIRIEGVEIEGVVQPDERSYFIANLTYTQGHYRDSSPFVLGGVDLNGLYDVPVAPAADQTLIGSDGQILPGDYRMTGLSTWVFKTALGFHGKSGWGCNLWGDWRSPQNGNILGQYTLPSQHTLNASVRYRTEHWEVAVSVLNFTNEENWVHNGDDFGSLVFIGRELPRRLEVHLKFRY